MIQQRKQFVVQTKLVTYFDETKPDVILPQMFMFLMIEGRRRNGGKFLKIKHIKARKMSSTDFWGLDFSFIYILEYHTYQFCCHPPHKLEVPRIVCAVVREIGFEVAGVDHHEVAALRHDGRQAHLLADLGKLVSLGLKLFGQREEIALVGLVHLVNFKF